MSNMASFPPPCPAPCPPGCCFAGSAQWGTCCGQQCHNTKGKHCSFCKPRWKQGDTASPHSCPSSSQGTLPSALDRKSAPWEPRAPVLLTPSFSPPHTQSFHPCMITIEQHRETQTKQLHKITAPAKQFSNQLVMYLWRKPESPICRVKRKTTKSRVTIYQGSTPKSTLKCHL